MATGIRLVFRASQKEIGDSMEVLESMRKKDNLVSRRFIDVDHIFVIVGGVPKSKQEEGKTISKLGNLLIN